MHHNDDIGIGLEGQAVTGFLIGPVTEIARMGMNDGVRQLCSDGSGLVVAGIIDDNNEVDDSLGHNFIVRLSEGLSGVISGHNNDNFLAIEHW